MTITIRFITAAAWASAIHSTPVWSSFATARQMPHVGSSVCCGTTRRVGSCDMLTLGIPKQLRARASTD